MKHLLALTLAFVALAIPATMAEGPRPMNNLQITLDAAAKDHKLAFVLLGRATCGNCNATKNMIAKGQIRLPQSKFVMADLNIDDPKAHKEFREKFGKQNFGHVLPFVVVADSHGKVLHSCGGYHDAKEWNSLLEKAEQNAAKAGGGTDHH